MTEAAKEVVRAGGAPLIAEVLRAFVDGFNTNSLDDVMDFFADDAVYEPGDGRTHRGRAAIREAFRPQFSHAFGTMRFVVNDQVVDEGARKATIRWVCQHDFATMKPAVKRWSDHTHPTSPNSHLTTRPSPPAVVAALVKRDQMQDRQPRDA